MTEFAEWRVTGDPGDGYPRYEFTWSALLNPHLGDPEVAARQFASFKDWPDGPHLSKRTVTVTDWEATT